MTHSRWPVSYRLYVFINLIHFHNGQRDCFELLYKLDQSNFVIASKWIKVFLQWFKVDQTHFHLVMLEFLYMSRKKIFIKMYRSVTITQLIHFRNWQKILWTSFELFSSELDQNDLWSFFEWFSVISRVDHIIWFI